jgi:HK97 family phage major capsid protein
MSIPITPALKQWLINEGHCEDEGSDQYYEFNAAGLLADGTLTSEKYLELTGDNDMQSPNPQKVFGRGGGQLRVKDPSEMYSEKRYAAKNKHGDTVVDPFYNRECETLSEAAAARHGVLLKHLAAKSGLVNVHLDDHERSLLAELTEKATWAGKVGAEFYDNLPGRGVKALYDDATSGGIEIVPTEFDADVVTFPLLNGELFPQVEVKPVPRGRRIEGASIGAPTMDWGGYDDAAIGLFDTADMVLPIETTIWVVNGAVEVGRDFLSDSPVEVGNTLTALIGERLAAELDRVVAVGNGTTEPEGIFTASGVTTTLTANGVGGGPTVGDYLALLFSVSKKYRRPQFRPCFVSNDTSYQRSRSIPVGAGDARLVMTNTDVHAVSDYKTVGYDHKISNDIGNSVAGFACLAKYRMYRRAGLEIRWEQGGTTLARRNMILLVFRARYGGRLMDANAMAKWTNGQA